MVFKKLRHIIVEQIGVDEDFVTLDATLEHLGCGDLDSIELSITVEDDFGIEIVDGDEWFELKTVGEAVKYIEGKI